MNDLLSYVFPVPSAFIERVGWILVHSVWQLTFVAIAAALFLRIASQRRSSVRYVVLVGLMVAAVTCPIVTWQFQSQLRDIGSTPFPANHIPKIPLEQLPIFDDHGNQRAFVSDASFRHAEDFDGIDLVAEPKSAGSMKMRTTWNNLSQQINRLLRPWLGWIVGLWIGGVFLLSLRPIVGCITLKRLTRVGVAPVSKEIQSSMARLSKKLELRRAVRVLKSTLAEVPLVVGYVRPTILLPASFVANVSAIQLDAILAHELAHIRRHDFVINLFQVVAETLLFFHPAVWWLSRQIRAEREHCCDDIAIAVTNNRIEYGRALLAIEAFRKRPAALLLAASDGSLIARVRRIVGQPPERPTGSAWVSLAFVACSVGTVLSLGGVGNRLANATDDQKPTDPTTASVESDILEGAAIPESEVVIETPVNTKTDVEIKYPYCIVVVEKLAPRPLAHAIDAFNAAAQQNPIGVRQSPITIEETLAAIAQFAEQPSVSDEAKQVLQAITTSRELPSNVYFRRFTRFDNEENMNGVWWVRLVVEGNQPPIVSVPIRSTHVFSRPYTQPERQQHLQQGVTLINRFSSYFEDVPNILLLAEFPEAAVTTLTKGVGSAIEEGDFAEFAKLFEWAGASESTRAFVKTEFETLTNATIHSIKVTPRNFQGNMRHWSAYQYFEPNLPIVGYLDIEYSTSDGGRRNRLSLEMGQIADEFRLVNYVTKGTREFPTELPQGLSIRGHTEALADGTFLQSTLISNPGTLISAHLANEEIWQRDFNGKYKTAIKSVARKIVAAAASQSWDLHACDEAASVALNGNRGFRIVLRRTWREYTGPPQQQAEVSSARNGPFIDRHADWEFVLFPESDNVAPEAKSNIQWADSKSPYHTRNVYLGVGHGYSWFSHCTLFDQENIRTRLELQGGDDRIQLLVDGLSVDDAGTGTANSCQHLVARFGNTSLPYLRKAVEVSQAAEGDWRVIGTLAYIRTPQATNLLLQYYRSDDSGFHQAAVYALVHRPYREDAKDAYLDMLAKQDRIDRLASACEAVVEYGWVDALPLLRQRIARPRSVQELSYTVAARRALEGKAIAEEIRQAEQTLRGASSPDRAPKQAAAIADATDLLVASEDNEAANLSALSLMRFVTKGNSEPVQQIGLRILTRRPRASTIEFLQSLSKRLPADERGHVAFAIDTLEDTAAQAARSQSKEE